MCLLLLCIATGCSSAPKPSAPAQWPASWDGRQAFDTDGAVIYARNSDSVDEVKRLVEYIGREFAKKTGGQATRGLVIINDADDAKIGSFVVDAMPPSDLIPPEILQLKTERREIVLAGPIELKRDQLTSPLGFSSEAAQTVSWAVVLPSERRVRQFSGKLLDNTMNDPQRTMPEKALMGAFMPLFVDCVADTVGGARGVMIYKQFCDTQPGWDDARRQKEFAAFKSEQSPADYPFSSATPSTGQ